MSLCGIMKWVWVPLLVIGCTKEVSQKGIIDALKQERIDKEFHGYHAYLFPRGGLRFVYSTVDSADFAFTRIFGFVIVNRIYAPKGISEQIVELRARKLIARMNSLRLVGFTSEPGYSIYYSSYQDSTYEQLVQYRRNYVDKESILVRGRVEGDLPYRLNFVHVADTSTLPLQIRRTHYLDKVAEEWYSFRSYSYADYDRF